MFKNNKKKSKIQKLTRGTPFHTVTTPLMERTWLHKISQNRDQIVIKKIEGPNWYFDTKMGRNNLTYNILCFYLNSLCILFCLSMLIIRWSFKVKEKIIKIILNTKSTLFLPIFSNRKSHNLSVSSFSFDTKSSYHL